VALLGNLEGVRLLGVFERKGNAYLRSFSLYPEEIEIKFGRLSGNLARNRAPLS